MIIRQAKVSDLEEVTYFLLQIIPRSYPFIENGDLFHQKYLDTADFSLYAQSTYAPTPKTTCLIAKIGNRIIGTVALKKLDDYTYEIHSLYVREEYQRKGIGKKLLREAENLVPTGSKLCLDVVAGNINAVQLYKRHGYIEKSDHRFPFRWDTWPEDKYVTMIHYEKYSPNLPETWKIGYCIIDESGDIVSSSYHNESFESSSTIKTPLTHYFMNEVAKNRHDLNTVLPIKKEHRSNGSGIVNWTAWTELPIHAIVDLTCVYSDCVTANMMIDYIGGSQKFNDLFRESGYTRSSLHKRYLRFSSTDGPPEPVGTTTPLEAANWSRQLYHSPDTPVDLLRQFERSTRNIHEPWFIYTGNPGHEVVVKTGSMIDTSGQHTSVYNVVGRLKSGQRAFYFSLFSSGKVSGGEEGMPLIRNGLSDYFSTILDATYKNTLLTKP